MKKLTIFKMLLIAVSVMWSGFTFGQGVFTSAATGNWNDAGSWTLSSGSDADGIPDADDNVTITTYSITVPTGVTVACNNLTVNNNTQRVLMQGASSILEIYGTLNAAATPTSETIIDCTADATAKVVFKRTTNGALFGTTWAAIGTGFRFEVNLPSDITGTASTAVKAREITITSGTFSLTGGLRPDNGVANGGILTIQNGATVIVTAAISRTGTTNTPFASLTMNGTAKVIVNGTFATPLPTVVSGFPVYTYSTGAVIEYQGGSQAIADINYPNLKLSAGAKSWALGGNRTITGDINVVGSAIFQVGGAQLTVSGNVTVDEGAQIGCSNNSGTIVAATSGTQTFTLNGLCRVSSNSTQAPTPTTGFKRQFSFDVYNIGANSIVSFRNPTATSSVSLNIDQPTGVSFANVEFYDIQTAAYTTTYLLKQNIVVTGSVAFPRNTSGQSYIFDMNGFSLKVGKQILNSLGTIGSNIGNTNSAGGTRTYTMNGTLELNGSLAQNTLGGTDLPQTFNNLIINNAAGVTVGNPITVSGTTTINDGTKLAMGATLTANGAVNVNGIFQLNASGWATGSGIWTYGSNGTLVFNNSSSYGVNNSDVFWPASSSPVNVSVLQGGVTLNSGTDRTVSGLFQTAAGVTLNSATLTLNGTNQINAGGYFANAPVYGSVSTLKYNTGATYGRGTEWSSPVNIQISNNTTLDYPNTGGNAFSTNLSIPGDLTIDAGSSLYMDYGGSGNKSGRLTVGGDITINGNLSLGNAVGGDLYVGGNWTRAASGSTFGANSREVRFNGSIDQSISNSAGENFAYLTIDNTNSKVLTLNDDVTVANNLSINGGSALTLIDGNSLTVSGDFTINSTANNTGTFVNKNATGGVTISGTKSIQQYLASARNWYMSSPVSDAKVLAGYTYYQYNEPDGSLGTNWTSPTLASVLTIGRGYIIKPTGEDTYNFSTTAGTLNDGNYPVTLYRTDGVTKAGFNLLGNPYPSYLNVDDLVNADVESSYWVRTRNQAETGWAYDTYNIPSALSTGNSGKAVSKFISPMQAFWLRVKSSVTPASLTFTNAMRDHKDDVNNNFRAPAVKKQSVLRLLVSNGTNSDEALVYFNENASNALDAYDSPKMTNGLTSASPDLYTMIGTEQLAINGMNTLTQEIPLYFNANTSSTNQFSLSATEVSNFDLETLIYIKNIKTGDQQLISDGSIYNFDASTKPNLSIIFKAPSIISGLDNNDNASFYVFANNKGQITVTSPAENENNLVSVYNAAGQCVLTQSLRNTRTVLNNTFVSGVYVVKVNDISRKIIVK